MFLLRRSLFSWMSCPEWSQQLRCVETSKVFMTTVIVVVNVLSRMITTTLLISSLSFHAVFLSMQRLCTYCVQIWCSQRKNDCYHHSGIDNVLDDGQDEDRRRCEFLITTTLLVSSLSLHPALCSDSAFTVFRVAVLFYHVSRWGRVRGVRRGHCCQCSPRLVSSRLVSVLWCIVLFHSQSVILDILYCVHNSSGSIHLL